MVAVAVPMVAVRSAEPKSAPALSASVNVAPLPLACTCPISNSESSDAVTAGSLPSSAEA